MPPRLASKLMALPLPADDRGSPWRGSLLLQGADDGAEFDATAELLSYFVRFAATGAFGAGSIAIDVRRRRGRLQAEVAASGLHPGTWRVLVQMLAHCRQMEPYDDFALQALDQASGWHADRRLLLQPYPTLMAPPAGVELALDEDALTGDSLDLRLTSARKLGSAEVKAFGERVKDWGSLAYTGGFTAVDQAIDEPLLDQPSTSRAGPQAIDVVVSQLAAPAEAWCSLVNLGLAMASRLGLVRIEAA